VWPLCGLVSIVALLEATQIAYLVVSKLKLDERGENIWARKTWREPPGLHDWATPLCCMLHVLVALVTSTDITDWVSVEECR
jgi:hypothetical protein